VYLKVGKIKALKNNLFIFIRIMPLFLGNWGKVIEKTLTDWFWGYGLVQGIGPTEGGGVPPQI
jgi:hypothetical protein